MVWVAVQPSAPAWTIVLGEGGGIFDPALFDAAIFDVTAGFITTTIDPSAFESTEPTITTWTPTEAAAPSWS